MATGKKYYWIKLKSSFLTSEKVDYLLSQPNGSDYVVIYQMLCLKTINTDGVLGVQIGEVLMPFDVNKIQRDLKHFNIDTIRIAMELFRNLGMIYTQENGLIKINDFNELVGSETDYALQKRNQRQLVDKGVDNVHIDIRDREKIKICSSRYKEAGHSDANVKQTEDILFTLPLKKFTNDIYSQVIDIVANNEIINKQEYAYTKALRKGWLNES